MSYECGQSDFECEIIRKQIARRMEYRCEFLRKRTDPCQHAKEAGFVFDPAYQRYASMKCTQYEYFRPSLRTSIQGVCLIVIPMFVYGYAIWKDRSAREEQIRCGKLKYKDRLFKLA